MHVNVTHITFLVGLFISMDISSAHCRWKCFYAHDLLGITCIILHKDTGARRSENLLLFIEKYTT